MLANDEHVIDVMEWVDAPRQGFKKNGQQNTQLELGLSKCAVKDVVIKLVKSLGINRLHQAEYEWRNWMRKIDLTNSHPDIHRIIYTNFGATLDLSAIEKDNCSVNNHAAVCILFVVTNWRNVKFKKKNENGNNIEDETIINDCDKWIFFADTISKGKKNDHVMHNSCLTYLIKYYDEERIHDGEDPLLHNIV